MISYEPFKMRTASITTLLLTSSVLLASCTGTSAVQAQEISAASPLPVPAETVSSIAANTWYIFQASNNHHWFGSDGNGVFRYDGNTITQFTTKLGLTNDHVRGIQEDKAGAIYVNTLNGISRFDGHTFTMLKPEEDISPMSEWKLQPDDLWFAGPQDSGTVFRYDGDTLYRLKFPETKRGTEESKRFPRDKFPNAIYSPYDVYTTYRDSKGHIWFGTATLGLCRFDGKSFDWLYEHHLTTTPNGGSFGIRSILEVKDRTFWICNTQYRYYIEESYSDGEQRTEAEVKYTRSTGIDQLPLSIAEKYTYFMSAVEGNDNALWMATSSNGVLRYDGKETTHFPIRDGDKDVKIFSIYKDKEGNLWLGTQQAGPYKFNGKAFEQFKPVQSK